MTAFDRRAGSNQLHLVEQSADPAASVGRALVFARPGAVIPQAFVRTGDGALYALAPKISTGFLFRDGFVNQSPLKTGLHSSPSMLVDDKD